MRTIGLVEQPACHGEGHPVQTPESRLPNSSSEDGELVTKDGVLDLKSRNGGRSGDESKEPSRRDVDQEEEHGRMLWMDRTIGESDFLRPTGSNEQMNTEVELAC